MSEQTRIDITYPNANWAKQRVERILDAAEGLAIQTDGVIEVEYTTLNPGSRTLENAEDAIFRVVDDVRALVESSTPFGFAQNLIDLQNSASNLATWHSEYDLESGRIRRAEDGDVD